MTSTQLKDKPVKYANWLTEANFDNCKLNRKAYGEFLIDYITSENDGFVLNLNGQWGAGKTEFLKRTYTELINRNHPTIYIDAWESDFCEKPLTVVASELLNQIECFEPSLNVSELDTIKQSLGSFLKDVLVTSAGIVTNQALGDCNIGMNVVRNSLEKTDSSTLLMDQLKSDYANRVDAIKEIRHELGKLATKLEHDYEYELPIVVLVDELDRCRPNYAIEMLEVIKHFFTTEHFVFIVGTDTNQLTKSIKAIYGSEFDSNQYLKRFFSRTAELPRPDLKSYLNAINFESNLHDKIGGSLNIIPEPNKEFQNQTEWLCAISQTFNLDIRTLNQLIAKLEACLLSFKKQKKGGFINLIVLVVAILEHERNNESFFKRENDIYTPCTLDSNYRMYSYQGNPTTIKELINIAFQLITYKESENERGRLYEASILDQNELTRLSNKHMNENIMNEFIDSLYVKIGAINQSPIRWNDYRKVIELAGNLE
ncbi:TPA: KAP family P-loop NTPase fold protein [Photobacterium damselae]